MNDEAQGRLHLGTGIVLAASIILFGFGCVKNYEMAESRGGE